MVDVFPTATFGFLDLDVDIERQTLKGGTALSGEEDRISTDGGGRVFAEFANGNLIDRDKVLAWRALLTILEEGVTPIVVPFCDIRHQPHGVVATSTGVPHSDGSPFSDGSLYVGIAGGGIAVDNYPLRATAMRIEDKLAQALVGGEWFAIQHSNKGWRAYKVARVERVTDTAYPAYDIQFRPPLREPIDFGTTLDFLNPRCLMVMDIRASARLQNRRHVEAAIRFVEAP